VAVVEANQAVGHARPPGEFDGLAREPERLLAQGRWSAPRRPRYRIDPRRHAAKTSPIAPKATSRGQPRGEAVSGSRRFDLARIAQAHSPKFQAVTVPTTAANWWLFRVAARLRALKAPNSKIRKTDNRQAGRIPDDFGFVFFLAPGRLPGLSWARGPPRRRNPTAGRLAPPTRSRAGQEEAQGPQGHRRQMELEGRLSRPTSWIKVGRGFNSPIVFLKIGLLIVPASWIG